MHLRDQIETSHRDAARGMDVPWVLAQWAARRPEHPCLIWRPFSGAPVAWTYAELLEQSQRLATGLCARGVKEGDFVLLHMDNAPEFVLSWYACAIVGAVAVSTNTRSVERDLSYFEEVTMPVCCLTQPRYARLIRKACGGLSFLAVTDTDAGEAHEEVDALRSELDAVPFDALMAEAPMALREADPAQDLGVQFTSGTTSRPKAVLWTHANGVWAGRVTAQHARLREDDVTLVTLPLFHTNAQAYSMLATHWSGGTVVVQPRFSASRYWDACIEHGVTWASMIPFSARAIMDQPVPEHRMRFWLFGARVPQLEDHFGVVTLGLWGMTETLTQGITVDASHPGPSGTIGRAAPEYDIQLRRPDGSLCEAGERGLLFIRGVRGVSLFKEYYRNPEANAQAFDEEGWFATGDVVRSDEDGWLYFCDRDKDMLKVGAENVAASEIETVIMQSGLAAECAVVGRRHYMLDEVPVVFLIPSEAGARLADAELEAAVVEHCRALLPDFKVVRSVHRVDELPRSMLHKVAKNVLRERLDPITEGR